MPNDHDVSTSRVRLGGELRRLRLRRGLSVRALGGLLLISPSSVSRRETGADGLTVDGLLAHMGALGARVRLSVLDGVGPIEIVSETPRDEALAEIIAAWPRLSPKARQAVLNVAAMLASQQLQELAQAE